MNLVIMGIALNINLSIVLRMIQGVSPLYINLSKIKEVQCPHKLTFQRLRFIFTLLVIYMGYPLSTYMFNFKKFLAYLLFWCPTICWWHLFGSCYFKTAIAISTLNSMYLIFIFDRILLPLVAWNILSIYLCVWYKSYVPEVTRSLV